MSTIRKCREASHLFQTLLKHVWNLLELCYKEKQTLRVCNITTALRILIYNILVLQNKVINAICVDGAWSHYGKYQYALQSHTLETLEFKFEMAKNARANLTKLRKRKLLQFCLQISLFIRSTACVYINLLNLKNSVRKRHLEIKCVVENCSQLRSSH